MIIVKQLIQAKENVQTIAVAPTDTVYRALEVMAEANVGAVLVMDADQMLGILTERDYARKVVLKGRTSLDTPISEIMTRNVFSVESDQTLEACMALMSKYHIRHLPVLNNGKLVGIVSMRDVLDAIINKKDSLIKDLEDYITGRT